MLVPSRAAHTEQDNTRRNEASRDVFVKLSQAGQQLMHSGTNLVNLYQSFSIDKKIRHPGLIALEDKLRTLKRKQKAYRLE